MIAPGMGGAPAAGGAILRLIVYSFALVGFLAIGRWVTQTVVRDHHQIPEDPASQTVARSALQLAHTINDNPAGRFFLPGAQVYRVYREEGTCTMYPAGSDIPHIEYVAEIRFFTLYAIPVRRERVTCGGWAWSGGGRINGRRDLCRSR